MRASVISTARSGRQPLRSQSSQRTQLIRRAGLADFLVRRPAPPLRAWGWPIHSPETATGSTARAMRYWLGAGRPGDVTVAEGRDVAHAGGLEGQCGHGANTSLRHDPARI